VRIKTILALFFLVLGEHAAHSASAPMAQRWIGSWAAAEQTMENDPSVSGAEFRSASLRQIVHLSIAGTQLRIRISNAFGLSPLYLTSVHVAKPSSQGESTVDTSTDTALTFEGMRDVTVPPGSDYLSDGFRFSAKPLSDLAITFHFREVPQQMTGHSDSRATVFLAKGDLASARDLPEAKRLEHWYFLSGVDVAAPADASSIVILGDSITDGHTASVNANDRWTDQLARRLYDFPATRERGVLNEGIGGNRLLLDGLGPNALVRFDRDVLSQSGVRYLIVLEGINDLGTLTKDGDVSSADHEALVLHILAAYSQMIMRAHDHGIRVIGATLMPYTGTPYYRPSAASEADRQIINQWIRDPGHFDGVIDFDLAMRDPSRPDHLLSALDSGDHIHPSPMGYLVMSNAVSIQTFSQ
jgi:lysophospholipase L1-like esterase